MNQTRVKPSVKLFGLGDCPFMKGSLWRRKMLELVNKLELPREKIKTHL